MTYTIHKPAKLLSCILFCASCAFAQQPATLPAPYPSGTLVNYIRSWDARAPESDANALISRPLRDVRQTTQYFDGLGRPLQTVVKQGSLVTNPADLLSSGSAVDMVAPVIYDEFGREQYKYLPFASTATDATKNDGLFKLNPFAQQISFYNTQLAGQNGETSVGTNGENWAYSKTNYEPSPLNRVDNTYAPGVSWVGSEGGSTEALKKNVRVKYYTNTATDDVKIWTVTDGAGLGDWGSYAIDHSLGVDGVYAAGTLYKTITIDEHDKQVIEFKDKEGKVILKKVQISEGEEDTGSGKDYWGYMCTYYIYDDLGRLRCVVPPVVTQNLALWGWDVLMTLSNNMLERGCYCYEYDGRGRMIMKKTPGISRAEAVYMVYDARDRLVMTQDGKQRKASVNIWMVTLYDNDLNRPRIKGFVGNAYFSGKTFKQHLAGAANSITYPFAITAPPSATYWVVLTEWGYDDYSGFPSGTGLNTTLDNTYTTSTYLNTTYNASPLYAQQPVQSNQTRGMVTWTKVLIYGIGTYYYTVNIYDDKGRVIQTKGTNITGGTDITTTQYNWTGQPIRIVQKQQLSGTGAQTGITLTDISYDDLGRAVQTSKKIQNSLVNANALPTVWTNISKNQYDALGQLKHKTLGNKRDASGSYTTDILSTLDYGYNVRGWLLSVNKDYTDATANNDRYFAMELGYDKAPSMGTYGTRQYNGNISTMLWKSQGDQQRRRYTFTYDNAGRLTAADFSQYVSGSGGSAVFDVSAGVDFSENGITYDYNGNIKTLSRKGLMLTGSPVIDQLTYAYYSYDNRPNKVSDAGVNTAANKLGDFQDGTNPADDYNYNNGNGSLTTDFNKGISGIEYWRTAELPKIITFAKGTISYIHDDTGNKLKKTTVESPSTANGNHTITTTTTYLGNAVFESKATSPADANNPDYTNRLQFIAHEEGRIRPLYTNASTPNTPTGFAYDYFIKDHLGNIRVVLTDENKQDIYPAATLEGDINTNGSPNAAYIEKNYYTINSAYVVASTTATGISTYQNHNGNPPANPNPNSVVTANSAKLYRLNSNTNKTGLGITLKVMAGDRIDIFGKSYYFQNNTGGTGANSVIPVLDILTGLLGGPTGGIAAASHGGVTASQLSGIGNVTGGITTLLGDQTTDASGTPTVPKAYINYIFFDEQFRVAQSGFSRVGSNSVVKTHTDLTNKTAPKNGYVYIYVSNESPVDVFFDNLQVIHTRGAILEETHYYPFGLTMAGISSKALNNAPENKRKYNGIEFNSDLDLNVYDAYYRNLDPQTGRWWQIDPMIEEMQAEQWSPYVSNFDNPIRFEDPLGDCPLCLIPEFAIGIAEAVEAAFATETAVAAGGAAAGTVAASNAGPIGQAMIDAAKANAEQIEATGYTTVQLGFTSIPVSVSNPTTKTITYTKPPDNVKPKTLVYTKPPDIVKPQKGSIYKVPGSETKSGKPYIGRHKKPDPAKTRRSNDGRNRKKAEVIDNYDPNNPQEGRVKEQKAIDDHGGVDNLDNKRNEIKKPKEQNE